MKVIWKFSKDLKYSIEYTNSCEIFQHKERSINLMKMIENNHVLVQWVHIQIIDYVDARIYVIF